MPTRRLRPLWRKSPGHKGLENAAKIRANSAISAALAGGFGARVEMTGLANLLVILGPTASGKSDLALELARRNRAQILSLDSMQVYRGMDIGTAKPTAVERAEVVHHLIDVVEPNQTFTVARFVEMADAVIRDAKGPLIATGGTPLYYKALFEGVFDGQ